MNLAPNIDFRYAHSNTISKGFTMSDVDTTQTKASQLPSIPAETRIGHVHLKVADLARAVWFYHDVMGFDLIVNMDGAAFLSAGGYHHHLGLNTWESLGGQPPAPGTTGLYHFAINYPTRRDLATDKNLKLAVLCALFNVRRDWNGESVPGAWPFRFRFIDR